MAKWADWPDIAAKIDERRKATFTWGGDESGSIHFYLDGARIGTATKDQLPGLIEAAARAMK